jgi:hypothetical protein
VSLPAQELEQSLKRLRWTRRWAMPLLGAVVVFLLPWTVWLTVTLPAKHVAEHWDAAWVGFDLAEVVALSLTAYGLWKRAPWVEVAASAAGTLLIADAWFDILLSGGDEKVWVAVAEAVFAEVPLAILCFWIAIDVARFWAGWLEVLRFAPPGLRRRLLHLAAAGERATERDLVRVLEIPADGQPAREARDADTTS